MEEHKVEKCKNTKDLFDTEARHGYRVLTAGDELEIAMKTSCGGGSFKCNHIDFDDEYNTITVLTESNTLRIVPVANISTLDIIGR